MRTVFIENKKEIEEIITACKTCYLGLADNEGTPYVVPMNFGLKDNVIYLHSAQEGRKWEVMQQNPKACLTFCLGEELAWQDEQIACSYRVKSKTVIVEGTLEFVDDYNEKLDCLKILMKQYSDREFNYNEPAIKNVGIMKLKFDTIKAKEFGTKAVTPWNS